MLVDAAKEIGGRREVKVGGSRVKLTDVNRGRQSKLKYRLVV